MDGYGSIMLNEKASPRKLHIVWCSFSKVYKQAEGTYILFRSTHTHTNNNIIGEKRKEKVKQKQNFRKLVGGMGSRGVNNSKGDVNCW